MLKKIFKNKRVVQLTTAVTAAYYGNTSVYCAGGNDAFSQAETALSSLLTKLWNISKKILPVAMAICIISLFVTHDERKLETEKRILVAMCVAFALLYLVADKKSIVDTITGLFGGGGATNGDF